MKKSELFLNHFYSFEIVLAYLLSLTTFYLWELRALELEFMPNLHYYSFLFIKFLDSLNI